MHASTLPQRSCGSRAIAKLETFENKELEQLGCTDEVFSDLLLA